jgi:ABC-type phosphate transport system substrate-binding protein
MIVSSVSSTPFSIGFAGYSFYYKNRAQLKSLSIDKVYPGKDTVYDKYILGRPLYLYSTKKMIESNKEVQAFIGCYLHYADTGKLYNDTGFFPPTNADFIYSIQIFNGIIGIK